MPALVAVSFSVASFFLLIFLYFLRAEIFTAWWRFARWYLVFSAALFTIIFFSDSGSGGGIYGMGGPSAGEFWPPFLAILFLFISLGIILKKRRELHEK
jgi:hypothetical protein